jgi:regulator of replication initiation timing
MSELVIKDKDEQARLWLYHNIDDLEKEIAALREENARLQAENEKLKKEKELLAWFIEIPRPEGE